MTARDGGEAVAGLTAEQREFRDDAALAALGAIAVHEQPNEAARLAYQYADAMLAARERGVEAG